jgi:hypothetical protein
MTHSWDGATKENQRREYTDPEKDTAARFLCADMNPAPLIRGLQSVEACRTWIDVETDSSEPDRDTIAQLNQRVQELRTRNDDHDATSSCGHDGADADVEADSVESATPDA